MMQEVFQEESNISLSQDISLQDQKQWISKQTLVKIVNAAKERQFADEIDELENNEGMEGIERGLQTNFEQGLKGDDFTERDQFYGNNRRTLNSSKTCLQMVSQNLEDYLVQILLVASIIQIVIGILTADEDCRSLAWIEGFALFIAVFVCCNVTAINDYQREQQFQSFNQMTNNQQTVAVLRNGNIIQLDPQQLMVGDIVQIMEGMQIPVDGFVVEAEELKADESALTGETDPIKKDNYENCLQKRDEMMDEKNMLDRYSIPSPVLLSGTRVLSGEGKMVVAVVGEASCVAQISSLLATEELEQTPLQVKLEMIASGIGKFGLIFSFIIFLILLLRFSLQRITEDSFEKEHIKEILNLIIVSITVNIIAVPYGFPLALTLCLAFTVKRMLKDNILVRKIITCEIMGGIDIVCSDKTGTLTQNKMAMAKIWNDVTMDIDVYNAKLNLSNYLPPQMHELFIQSSIVNGAGEIRPQEKGSQTEVAILQFAEKCGINYENERNLHQSTLNMPFSSQRKRIAKIIQGTRLVVKGTCEMILESCNKLHSKSKGIIPIDSTVRKQIEDNLEQMSAQAFRTVGLAYKDLNGDEDLESKNDRGVYDIETQNLTLIAIVGFKDILRAEVPQAVANFQSAGIKVNMITGDNKNIARATAIECGILIDENQSLVLEGYDFANRIGGIVCKWCQTSVCDCPRDQSTAKLLRKQMRVDTIQKLEEFDKIYPQLDVLARSRPEDKYALVLCLQERGHIVAVTGDGTNDAPAIQKADVGIALGIAGTEIAKQSASIILLDDNFSSIVKVVLWGRNIYDSIKKMIQFQLTAIIVVVVITLFSSVLIKQEVFKPIQMLWINLIIDSFASLALATETPTSDLLQRKYHNRNEQIVCPKMIKHIIGQAIYQIIIILMLLFYAHTFIPEFKGQEDESSDYMGKLQFKYQNTYFNEQNNLHTCPNYQDYCNLISYSTDYNINGSENYHAFYKKTYIPSRQFTVIFNTFIMMQLFNFINSRRIKDELNIFSGIFNNTLFSIIFFGIFILQIIMVTFGGIAFHCYSFQGLTIEQWLICITLGASILVVRFILRLCPDNNLESFFKYICKKNPNYQLQFSGQESEIESLNNPNQEN